MKKQDLLRYVGNIQQVISAREITYEEGRAGGMKAYQVKNGPLSFLVMADKCLDIGELSYRATNISFLSKPGLQGRNPYDTNGEEALRSIMGGMVFTCGLENICPPCRDRGKDYPMHGRMRTTPAEHVGCDIRWEQDSCCAVITGEMREAELFGENMVLRRTISTRYPGKRIVLTDEIENQGFREEPMMLLYHCNAGYPLLQEESEIVLPTKEVIPRDAAAEAHTEHWNRMEAPKDGEPEYVFLHRLGADEQGNPRTPETSTA